MWVASCILSNLRHMFVTIEISALVPLSLTTPVSSLFKHSYLNFPASLDPATGYCWLTGASRQLETGR